MTIKKISPNKWRLYSKDGSRNLGTFSSLAGAKKHEREVQYFKHHENAMPSTSLKDHFLLDEDIFSDLVQKHPQLKDKLEVAKKQGVLPKYLPWLVKILSSTTEPVEDIIPLLKTFDKKKEALKAKFGGNAADINGYKTAQQLSNKIEQLHDPEKEKKRQAYKQQNEPIKESEKLYEDDEWILIMPETTEESCRWGANTTWCTARTQSQNLFLSYVARDKELVLFYLIKKDVDPRHDPDAKLSIGFVHGEPRFDGQYGGITVNAANDGIDEVGFYEILGNDRGAKLLEIMKQKAASIGGGKSHPAKLEIAQVASSAEKTDAKLKSFKNNAERNDFAELLMRYVNDIAVLEVIRKNLQTGSVVANRILRNSMTDHFLFEELLKRQNLNSDLIRYVYEHSIPLNSGDILTDIINNVSTPKDIIIDILKKVTSHDVTFVGSKTFLNQKTYLERIAQRGNLSEEAVNIIVDFANSFSKEIKMTSSDFIHLMAWNTTFPYESVVHVLQTKQINSNDIESLGIRASDPRILKLLSDRALAYYASGNKHTSELDNDSYYILSNIIHNEHTTPEVLQNVFDTIRRANPERKSDFEHAFVLNKKTPPEILIYLAKNAKSEYDQVHAMKNPGIGEETLRRLTQSPDKEDRIIAAMNPATPIDSLRILAVDPDLSVKLHLAMGRERDQVQRLPEEILQILRADPQVAGMLSYSLR